MFIARLGLFGLSAMCLLASNGRAAGLPDDCSQLIVGVAPDWNSMRGRAQLFEHDESGHWKSVGSAFPVLFGKNGLAWGSGLAGQDEKGLRSEEHTSELQSPQ